MPLVTQKHIVPWVRSAVMVILLAGGSMSVNVQAGDERKRDDSDQKGNQLVSEKRNGISKSQAVARVKERYQSSRVMGIARMDGSTPLYKVRLLSQEGVVKSVFVDGRTGEVFE